MVFKNGTGWETKTRRAIDLANSSAVLLAWDFPTDIRPMTLHYRWEVRSALVGDPPSLSDRHLQNRTGNPCTDQN